MYKNWKVYYADGTAIGGQSVKDFLKLPKIGVIAINQDVEGARRTLAGFDFYWVVQGEWMGGDRHGADMYLMQSGYKLLFYGINVNTHIFKSIMRKAHKDPEFPAVTDAKSVSCTNGV